MQRPKHALLSSVYATLAELILDGGQRFCSFYALSWTRFPRHLNIRASCVREAVENGELMIWHSCDYSAC